jgi:enamine deaminase RidA (YjgF/YER057c/UK114 family)
MDEIKRIGAGPRWSDVVIYGNVARWVEVPEQLDPEARRQIQQVVQQIDATLAQIGSHKTQVLEVLIFLADLDDKPVLDELWDQWVVPGQAPIRAAVQAGLGSTCRVEMIVTAAVPSDQRFA